MTRRRTRPRGIRPVTETNSAGRLLLETIQAHGTSAAKPTLDAWRDRLLKEETAFDESVKVLMGDDARVLSREERTFLFGCMAELIDDLDHAAGMQVIEAHMAQIAHDWGVDVEDVGDSQLMAESPEYAALGDAWSALRTAIEVSFLSDVGAADVARMMLYDTPLYERQFGEGYESLVAAPPPIEFGDEDPFGIMLPERNSN